MNIKITKNKLILMGGVLLSLTSINSFAGVCGNEFAEKVQARIDQLTSNLCDSEAIDTTVTLEGPNGEENPYVYTNPDASCDLGFEMPGLPSFGGVFDGSLDSCAILKSVTGGLVSDVNSAMQSAVDETMDSIDSSISTATGGIISTSGGTTSLQDIATDAIETGLYD